MINAQDTFIDSNVDRSNRNLEGHIKDYKLYKNRYLTEARKVLTDRIEGRTYGLLYKSRVLFTLLLSADGTRYSDFRGFYEHLELSDILKACEMLDAPRKYRQLEGKVEKHPESKRLKVTLNEYGKAMTDVLYLSNKGLKISFSKSKVEAVRGWVSHIPVSKLEYMAMMFDTGYWMRLADMCHFNPEKDFQLNWFLRFCYGAPAPEGSVVNAYSKLTLENFHEVYDKYRDNPDFNYKLIRLKIDLKNPAYGGYGYKYGFNLNKTDLKDKIRDTIVESEGLTTVLWYWDELVNDKNLHSIVSRLREDPDVNLSYGAIADIISKVNDKEALVELVRLAESRMGNYQLSNKAKSEVCPVAVLGDASASMDVAIKTSSIIASLLCFLTDASLDTFAEENIHEENPPRTVEEAVNFGKQMKTRGCTNPAASLGYYYYGNKKVNTFIIVTDEVENRSYRGDRFRSLYHKYIRDVNLAKLIFISFSDPNRDAQMVQELRANMDAEVFSSLVSVYKFNVKDPDLNRMDIVLKDLDRENELTQTNTATATVSNPTDQPQQCNTM